MAKVSSVQKNLHRQKLVCAKSDRRKRLKNIVMDQSKPLEERFKATIQLSEMPRNSAQVRVRNRCQVSGRPRAYYRKLKMSRIALRELGSLGYIPGIVKSSW